MGRKPTKQVEHPSFFEVLLDDFSKYLRIPRKFSKKHIPPSLGKCVLRGPCRKTSVELERRKNGVFFHDHGWRSFVKDHHLQFGDFLVFKFDGKKNFKVKIYDRTCCEREVEAPKKRNGPPTAPPSANKDYYNEIVDDHETESCSSDGENADKGRRTNYMSGTGRRPKEVEDGKEPSARTIIFKSAYSCFKANFTSKSSWYRAFIPKGLVNSKGLRSKKTIDIEDSTGRLWTVRIACFMSPQQNYVYISTGWTECSKANNVAVGDVVVFEFVEETVLRLHVIRKGVEATGGDSRSIFVVLDAPNVEKES